MVPSLPDHPTTCRRPSLSARRGFVPLRPQVPPDSVVSLQNGVGSRQELVVRSPNFSRLPVYVGSTRPRADVPRGSGVMSRGAIAKRCVDVVLAALLLVLTLPVILISALITLVVLRAWPFFTQTR